MGEHKPPFVQIRQLQIPFFTSIVLATIVVNYFAFPQHCITAKHTIMKNNLLQSFLSFHLKNESFALGVNRVLEIIEVSDEQSITYLPKSPETIEGVVNFRGQVIPVVNMRLKFDMEAHTTSDKYVIMVLNLNINGTEQVIGAMADKVVDVLEIAEEDIQDVPEVGQGINSEFIQGLVHRDKQFIMLLDIEKAINSEEIIQLKDSLEEEEETIPNQIHV